MGPASPRLDARWVAAGLALGLALVPATPSLGQNTHAAQDQEAVRVLEQKCAQCHGEARMSGLDLRTREAAVKGGEKGPSLIPGDAEASTLYRRVAGLEQPAMPMAPIPALSASEIAALKGWIERGAPWAGSGPEAAAAEPEPPAASGYGKTASEKPLTDAEKNWWAFRKPVRHPLPQVSDSRWSRNPIDAFIRKALEDKGLEPAPAADRNTLIRRAYLDLLGLLPSPDQVDEFVNDPDPNAYEKLIESLLASPHYGERWGRFWLDVARYADSSGYEHDRDLANAWRYRDYVIRAFNEDKPFNRFIVEQLAGDEVEDRNYDSLIATAFYRIGPRVRFREKDNPYYRYEYLDDILRTTFQGFMGLSVHCARCHDHKFDPISQMDYFRSMATVFSYVDYEHPLAPADKVAEYERIKAEVDEEMRPLMRQIAQIELPYRKAAYEKRLSRFPEEIQIAVRTPEEQRTPGQRLLAAQITSLDVDPDALPVTGRYRPSIKVSPEDDAVRGRLIEQIEAIRKRLPEPLPVVEGVRDGDYRLTPDGPGDEPLPGKGDRFDYGVECCFLPQPGKPYEPPPVYFGANGNEVAEDQKSFVVEPGFLRVLARGDEAVTHPPQDGWLSSGRRRALAEWIGSPDNPLTARVMANRIWYWHFGRGIVPTPGNFGKMGMPPSHPELLDWLATEFIAKGWSIKEMHRLIMTSETYRMSSSFYRSVNAEKDPTNVHFWRFPMRRLEAEAIRDAILSASGQINLVAGGEPFFPSIPMALREGYRQGKWDMTKEEPSTWRRSIYSYWKRGLKYPMFEVHDQPDLNVTCERRNVTTVPTQALTLLNNEFVLIQAGHLARRVEAKAGPDPAEQVRQLYRTAVNREPLARELAKGRDFLEAQRDYHSGRGSESAVGEHVASPDLAALTDLAHVMLNSNEFVYIN